MRSAIHVWPATGAPVVTFEDVDRVLLVADDGMVDEDVRPGEKVLMLNPANAVAWVVDTRPVPAQRDGALDLGAMLKEG